MSISFDRAAGYYDETRGFPPGMQERAISLMTEAGHWREDSRILEIGVGTGRISVPVASVVGKTYGVDLSREMMGQLRAKDGAEKVRLTQGDVTLLPFPAALFDSVIAVHIFHLVSSLERALDEVDRVLKPGGVLFHGRSSLGLNELWEVWQSAVGDETSTNVVKRWDRIRDVLDSRDWRKLPPLTIKYTFTRRPIEYVRWFEQRYFSATWTMPDEILQTGVAAVREALAQAHGDLDEPVEFVASFTLDRYAR